LFGRRKGGALPSNYNPGHAVDSQGQPAIDPTKNVLDLVAAAIQRQDDLRSAESRHIRELLQVRAEHVAELRRAESARIDAIRAVDVAAVNRAAEVAAQQANTLAQQVAISADTLRNQVESAEKSASNALRAALEPIQKDIADLRRAQYEAQGSKTQTGETRLNLGTLLGGASLAIAALVAVFAIVRGG
jgi:hypothetical protein